jgi:rhamnose transport system ATP-binding protein
VMHEGKLTAELARSEATEEAIMFAATGQTGSSRDRKTKTSSSGQS